MATTAARAKTAKLDKEKGRPKRTSAKVRVDVEPATAKRGMTRAEVGALFARLEAGGLGDDDSAVETLLADRR